MDVAVNIATTAVFSNNGEQCDAGSRTFVHESIYDEFVTRVVAKAKTLVVGSPLDANTHLGPMIDKEQFNKVLSYFEIGQKDGATLAFGGHRIGTVGYFVSPTIFTHVTDDMRLAKEEVKHTICIDMLDFWSRHEHSQVEHH